MKKLVFTIFIIFICNYGFAKESNCFGTTSNGRLEGGVNLPAKGSNFVSYSRLARLMGRTFVHSKVKNIVIAAYKSLETSNPDKVFKYAETGFEEGGKFRPHKTHQNGLSVDFMVPIINDHGKSVHLPTNPLNTFGYSIEFDNSGRYEEYKIDFGAMAAHIVSLHKVSLLHKAKIWRVIFDPVLQPGLFKTRHGEYLKKNIKFSRKRSWVRHDEHYHIDFIVRCNKL